MSERASLLLIRLVYVNFSYLASALMRLFFSGLFSLKVITAVRSMTTTRCSDARELANGVLSFTASGPSGQIGYVSATVPIGFNSTDITVFNNGRLVQNPVITTDGSDYLISFEISLSTHNIIIQYGAEAATLTSSPTPIPTASPTPSPSPTPSSTTSPTPNSTASPNVSPTSPPSVPEFSSSAFLSLLILLSVSFAVVLRRRLNH